MKLANSKTHSFLLPLTTSLTTVTLLVALSLSGCASNKPNYNTSKPNIVFNHHGVPNYHQVKKGDTISKIAQNYGMNYRKLARLNHLNKEYTIYADQWLKLWNKSTSNSHKNSTKNTERKNTAQSNSQKNNQHKSYTPPADYNTYYYPTQNAISRRFGSSSNGLWFSGRKGDPVYAAQGGTIIYIGKGLPEFGNLVMILHADNLVTAYAHNSKIWVSEGSFVSRGQKIAEMGKTGNTNQVGLQFQIRQNGIPINPMEVLRDR